MGRRMRSLDPGDGPAELFACELRALRSCTGNLPFWKMAQRCSVSKSALAAATAGYQIPSEQVTREFVRVCGGDWAWWCERRLRAIADLEAAAETAASDRFAVVLARPAWPVPAEAYHLVRYQSPDPPRGLSGRRRFRRACMLAVLMLAIAGGWLLGRSTMPRPVTDPVTVARGKPLPVIRDGQDPYIRGCGKDQQPLERQPVYRRDGAFYGWLVLYYSARCSASWGYVYGPNSPDWTVYVRARRMPGNVIADTNFRGRAVPNSWGNALSTRTGCVRAEAWVADGPHAVTSCWSPGGPVTSPAAAVR